VAYELFERSAVRVDTPALSVAPGGRVNVNAAACRLLREAGIKTIVILWDRLNNKMALRAAPNDEKNSFTITFGTNYSGSFRAKSFFDHIGWRATEMIVLSAKWNASEKMLEVSLPAQTFRSGGKSIGRRH